jgi:thiamine pyrophosphate-dependent acetolactate synthase large subunit-like protein
MYNPLPLHHANRLGISMSGMLVVLPDRFHRLLLDAHFQPKTYPIVLPDPIAVERAAGMICSARKPLRITGRSARRVGREPVRLLDKRGAADLDTGESRGLVPNAHPRSSQRCVAT